MRPRLAALALVLAAATLSAAPAGAAAKARGKERAPYAVGKRSLTFVDRSRPTDVNGSYPGAPTRTLPTLLLYPAAKGDPAGTPVDGARPLRRGRGFPLVVFSHGFTGTGPAYEALLTLLARRGYVVAAPTFPLSSRGAPGGPRLVDYVNQPADVSFVLSRTQRLAGPRHSFHRTIDPRRIGAAGHSLGAVTTLGVSANTCCQDRRIDAAVAMSGIQAPFPGGTFHGRPTPPLMLLHGDADGVVPLAGSTAAYEQARPPKVLVTLLGGPHTPFLPPWLDPTVGTTTAFFDRYLKGDRRAVRRLLAAGTVPGVATVRAELRP
jgi:predicted dienelactone hydrolase